MDRPHPRALQSPKTPFHQTEVSTLSRQVVLTFLAICCFQRSCLGAKATHIILPRQCVSFTRRWQIILVHKLQTVNLKPRSRIESNTNGTERPIRRFLITDPISRNAMYYGAVPFGTLKTTDSRLENKKSKSQLSRKGVTYNSRCRPLLLQFRLQLLQTANGRTTLLRLERVIHPIGAAFALRLL